MKTHTNKLLRSSLALALALAIWSPVQSQSAEPAGGKNMMEGKMTERCRAMMAKRQKMQAYLKAQDKELAGQVARMNKAPDDKKVALMAGVITMMAEQRIASNERMAKMKEEMMPHMMQHMQRGGKSMSQCPMMKGMRGMGKRQGDTEKK